MSNFNIPILQNDSADYIDGNIYHTRVLLSDTSQNAFSVRHEISGNNLVRELLLKNRAQFAAEACAPASTYRQIFVEDSVGVTSLVQEVSVPDELIVSPLYVRPLVISDTSISQEITLDLSHGVHEMWHGVTIAIDQASILALGEFETGVGIHSLLKTVESKDLKEGTYYVRLNTSNGFFFEMNLPPQLFSSMRNPGNHEHRNTLLTAGLASGFHQLKNDYADPEEWQQHVVLLALHKELRARNLPTWEDSNFEPDEIASSLKHIELAGVGENV